MVTTRLRQSWCAGAGALLIAALCAGIAPVRGQHRPAPPKPVPLPSPITLQRLMAREQSAALLRASRPPQNVVRVFTVGWEMHHGYFLTPFDKRDDLIMPDFLDENVSAAFDAQSRQEVYAAHVGERLLCDCTGVTWHFYTSERFIVRAAKLRWVK
jgi:hypothetical protein